VLNGSSGKSTSTMNFMTPPLVSGLLTLARLYGGICT